MVAAEQPGTGRLNKVIALIEGGGVAFGTWLRAGSIPDAIWIGDSAYDFGLFDLEHDAFDLEGLRISLQFMLNGRERDEWLVKQLLDLGVYGVVFPTINTVEDARHALQAMRYPAAQSAPDV